MPSREDLHDYQERAVEFVKSEKRCGLILEMGLGKSVSTLTAISDLIDGFAVSAVLVIAPLRVANSVWTGEVAKWTHLHGLRVSLCTGTEKERMKGLMQTADVYVINRENVEWLVTHYGKKWRWDMVVIDESSSFKSPSSKRFKALKRILPMTEYMVLLTGTPAPNGLLDLWSQSFLIDTGDRLGKTYTGFKQRFFEADYMGYKFTPRAGSAEKIHELLSDKMLSMQAADYLELPERIDLIERVTLPDSVMRQYLDFEKEMLMLLPEGDEIEALSAAAMANKLLQFANGATYIDETKKWSLLHDAKLDALEEIIEANQGEPVLVAYNYKHDLERLLKRFSNGKVLDKSPDTVTKWNRGEIPLLFAHPASAGHGLNLQDGGALAVWFGLNWSLEYYQQFNARLHRQGQTKPVRIVHIVTDGTIDERVLRVLQDKDATQDVLIKALKG